MIPHTTPPQYPAGIGPGRFAAHIHEGVPVGCRVALLGLPDDLGVRLNGGRAGAREGPRAFREALARYGAAEPAGWVWPRVFDAGDAAPAPGNDAAALAETHRRVTEAVAALVAEGLFPVGIGGGHDLTFPFVRGATRGRGAPAGVYFDAHLDVRAEPGSGMAFRSLVEQCGVAALTLHGFNPIVNSAEHLQWFEARGGRLAEPNSGWSPSTADLFVSMDLDVLDGSHAPGVSAVNPAGWSVERLAEFARSAGADERVRCFDIMELCPPNDEGGRTARAAAHLFLSFLRGFSERPPGMTPPPPPLEVVL